MTPQQSISRHEIPGRAIVRRSIIILLTCALTFGAVFSTSAATAKLDEFTQSELDTNWEPDRQAPSDGVTSVVAFNRDNVARIGIDSSATQPGLFQRTEGIKSANPQNYGEGLQVDLYIDPDWQDKAVRAGFWVVGYNGDGGRDNLFAILEFVNNEPCFEPDCTNAANITDHEGWRTWNSETGWTDRPTAFQYGEWVTLGIELDAANELYHYSLNGVEIGTAPGGQHYIYEAFLNSYNYGEDSFPTLSSADYAAHWHAGLDLASIGSTYTLCVNYYTGGQLVGALNGACPTGTLEIEATSETPLTFCINPYTRQVSYSFNGSCSSPYFAHVVPDNGDLLTCMSMWTGKHRYVYNHAQCMAHELPNTIEAGV